MNIINKVDRVLSDNNFKIIYCNHKLNINNYIEIMDFSTNCIKIKFDDGICLVNGNNLCVCKMIDNEVLIEGDFVSVILS